MSDLKERTDALITQKSFSICSCPLTVIKDFKEFCRVETNGYYWMGLKVLLERNKISFQQEVFAMKINELEHRLDTIESSDKEEEPKAQTFGKKEVKEDVKTK